MNIKTGPTNNKIEELEKKIDGKIDYISCNLTKQIEQVEEKIFVNREKIAEMDKKIWQIQKSTKTLFKIFERPHNWLRSKSKTYYNWHLNPYANSTHWIAAIVALFLAVFLSSWQLGFFGGSKPASMAAAGIPKMINYQGKLTDLNNIPKPDGTYSMKFSIYDSPTGGNRLWTCTGTLEAPTAVSISVQYGIFSAMLGSGGDCTNALGLDFNSDAYYLGVTVGSDSEMADRKRIGAVGYAYNSDTVDGKNESDFALLAGRAGGQTIIGGTAANDVMVLQGNSASGNTSTNASIQYKVGDSGGTTAMTILNNGNIGIGTTAPSTLLQLGTSGTKAGTLSLAGVTSGLVTLQTAAEAGIWTFTLPTSAGTADYVLKTDGNGVTSWVAQTGGAGYWTDGGNYLYPTAYESIRVYDSGGTDYIDIAHDSTDAIISFANTTALNINIGVIDLSAQTVDVTLDNTVDALNFDSNTLSIDASNNRIGVGTASPTQTLEVTGTGKFSSDNINSFQVSKADGTYVMNVDTTNSYVGIGDGTNVNYFDNTGSDQSFIVPAGVTSITVKLWGAGGGGGANSSPGGGGGYATATLDVTPGETLTIMVGTGGQYRSGGAGQGPTVYGGGGNTGTAGYGGQGGGRSAIKRSSTELITAGGGGGAGWDISGDWGGGGGGSVGQDANNGSNGGKGGTQSAGGAGGGSAEAGSAYQGGTCNDGDGGGGGGGGGGYYGGGAGTGSSNGGGGGGGSAYVPAGGSTLSGSGATPGNNSDSDRGTAGTGGPVGVNGYSGRVVISYAGGLAKNTLDVFGSIAAGSYAGVNTSPDNGLVISGNVGIGTYSPSTLLQLGTAGTTAGVLSMAGGTSGLVTLQTAAVAGTWTMTLPTSAGTADYVLKTDGNGVTSWVAQTGGAGYWTDGGNYLYPTAYESIRVYDSGGTDYIDIAQNGTDALMTFANTSLLNIDSNTLVVDVANDRVGMGTASPAAVLDITTSNTAYDTTARVARITNSSASGQSPFDYYINGTLRGRTRVDYGGNFTIMANGGYFSFLSGGDYGVGTEVMRILANGNVGIGTTSPSTLFQVGNTGSIKGVLSLAGNTSGLVTIQPAAAAGTWTFTLPTSAGTADYVLKTDGNGVTSWAAQTGGVSYWTLSGNSLYPNSTSYAVGIGTTSPDRELEVGSASVSGDTTIWAGTTSWGEGLRLIAKDSNSYGAYFIGSATDDANGIEWGFGRLNIASGDGARNDFNYSNKDWSGSGLNVGNSSTQLWLDKSTGYSAFGSRLGVNTSSPQAYLHVKGTISYGSARISPTSDNGEAALAFFQDAAGTDTNDSWVVGQGGWGNTSDLVFGNENNGAGGDVRMLLEKGGNIGISTTSPSARLDVHGAGTGTGIALQTADSNGNAKFSILDNGQMGLGTTSTNEVITANGRLSLQETESPSSTSGYGKIYPKSSDSNLYYMNASGTEYKLNVTSDFYWSRNSGSGYVYLTTGTDSVGIGTSAPDRKLEVVTDINTPQVRFSYGDDHYIELMATNGYSSFSSTDRTIRLTSGSTTTPKYTDISTNTDGYLYINPQGGYTGLGTSVPNRRLEVNTDVNTPQARFSYTSDHYIELMATNGYSSFSSTDRTIRLTSGSTSTPKYTDISTNTDGYLYINPEGLRTGLGISTPSRTLEVAVNFNTAEEGTPPLRVTNNTGSGYKWIEFYPFNGGTNITSNGAEPIGIQNTNPRRAVDVYNSDNPQFRITQTIDTNYVDFQATSSGYLYINSSGSRVGIGDSTPDAFFSVGASSQFQVDSSGNIIKIRNVTYSWPSSQGSANTYLKNDGSGNLSWASDMVGSSYVGECTASTTTPEGSAECTITDAKYLMISGFDSGADAQHTCAVHFQGNVGGTAHGYAWLGAGGTISSCTFIGFK